MYELYKTKVVNIFLPTKPITPTMSCVTPSIAIRTSFNHSASARLFSIDCKDVEFNDEFDGKSISEISSAGPLFTPVSITFSIEPGE